MPIRKEDDGLSRVRKQRDDYFRYQDNTISPLDFNRFLYMPVGSKMKSFDWRLDWKKAGFPTKTFLIDHEKFVNRPDSIAFDVYGNSKYWWIIAMMNDITDPFTGFYKGRTLLIPELELVKRSFGI